MRFLRWPLHVADQQAAAAQDHGVTKRDVVMAISTLRGMREGLAKWPADATYSHDDLLALFDSAIASFELTEAQMRP